MEQTEARIRVFAANDDFYFQFLKDLAKNEEQDSQCRPRSPQLVWKIFRERIEKLN